MTALLTFAAIAAVAWLGRRRRDHVPRALELGKQLSAPAPQCGTTTTSCARYASGMVPVGYTCHCVALPNAPHDPRVCGRDIENAALGLPTTGTPAWARDVPMPDVPLPRRVAK